MGELVQAPAKVMASILKDFTGNTIRTSSFAILQSVNSRLNLVKGWRITKLWDSWELRNEVR